MLGRVRRLIHSDRKDEIDGYIEDSSANLGSRWKGVFVARGMVPSRFDYLSDAERTDYLSGP